MSLLINQAIEKQIPILGICTGSWFLNVAHGGSLKQEVTSFSECDVNHDVDTRNGKVVHKVEEGYLAPSDIAKQQAIFSSMSQAVKQPNKPQSLPGTFWDQTTSKSRAIAYHVSNTEYLLNQFNAIGKYQFCCEQMTRYNG